jgi:hypothetical protein
MTTKHTTKDFSKKNIVLNSIDDIDVLIDILEENEQTKYECIFSNDFSFEYYDWKSDLFRGENIFKANWLMIVNRLIEFFPHIKINIFYETASLIQKKILDKDFLSRHDVYITIEYNNTIYDIALEYFEKKSHNNKSAKNNDNDKRICSIQETDIYLTFNEKTDDFDKFMENSIHKLLLLICVSNNDYYSLAKINFFRNDKNNKYIARDTKLFNFLIEFKKSDKNEFLKIFKILAPKDIDTEESFTFDEFVEYLNENHDIEIDEDNTCSYEQLESIIFDLHPDISDKLGQLKNMYRKSMKILFSSSEELINFAKLNNIKKKNLPKYISQFVLIHGENYSDDDDLRILFERLKIKFDE